MSISKHKFYLAILDVVIIVAGFCLSFWFVFASGCYVQPRPYPLYFIPSIAIIALLLLITFQLEGLYKYQAVTNTTPQLQSLLKCYVRILAGFILIVFFMRTEYIADSRLTIGLGFLFSFLVMVISRVLIVPRLFFLFIRKGLITKRTLIVGAGEQGSLVCKYLENNPKSYFKIVAFCDDDENKCGTSVWGRCVVGGCQDLMRLAKEYRIKEVIIAINNTTRGRLLDVIDQCKKAGLTIHIISDLFMRVYEKLEAEEFGGLVTYRIVPRRNGIVRVFFKRGIDLIGSLTLLIILSPLYLLIAWFIKRDSEGPVFYRGEVIGKNAKHFFAYKFRSMINGESNNKEEVREYEEGKKRHIEFMKDFIQGKIQDEYFVNDESRVTRVGKKLRKYSLDELPQLINVLRGEMSLVGPRFCSPVEFSFYQPWHKRRFEVKPGLTGLWQVCGRSAVSYDDMVILDLYYIENQSFLLDLEILLRTVSVVLFGKGSRVMEEKKNSINYMMNEWQKAQDKYTPEVVRSETVQ